MSSIEEYPAVELHGRTYRLPRHPTVVVCIDGFDPEYLQAGLRMEFSRHCHPS
jgi:hypothetical protein